ncbi:MAG: peptidase dimerization domain-containing protein, partial [Ilumatobacteraceae bacterium]
MTDATIDLDARVAELSQRYLPLARDILRECIRIPADYVDRPVDEGGDPMCGLSNHEGPRLEFLKQTIIDIGAVRHSDDVWFDDYGNLVWTVSDPDDGVFPDNKRVVYFDGHTDTVNALRSAWKEKLVGIDAYDGMVDIDAVDRDFLRTELGHLPPDDEWDNLIFGRGAADQLSGVVSQVIATKIALELAPEGALRGVIVRAYATACEEDNDGAGPIYVMKEVLPGARPDWIPDVVILTEGTGDAYKGALGIYRGQRGRMQIEVSVTGRSCHGSMPWEGLNPLEHGGAIIAEAARRYDER